MRINGSKDPDEQAAVDFFPHTRTCTDRIRVGTMLHGKSVSCTCKQDDRRRRFLLFIRSLRRRAYVDAYAKIRFEARQRAERAKTPQERQAFQEVASWAEELEFEHLNE